MSFQTLPLLNTRCLPLYSHQLSQKKHFIEHGQLKQFSAQLQCQNETHTARRQAVPVPTHILFASRQFWPRPHISPGFGSGDCPSQFFSDVLVAETNLPHHMAGQELSHSGLHSASGSSYGGVVHTLQDGCCEAIPSYQHLVAGALFSFNRR